MTERKPVIFGVGGLLERRERGKITDMLDILSQQYGCKTYEVSFPDITADGNTIVCGIHQNDYENFQKAVNLARADKDSDMNRVGVITSSMGAVSFIEYLASSRDLTTNLKAYAANVPFTRINPQAKRLVSGAVERGIPLDISSKFDKQREIKRIIPVTSLPYLIEFDGEAKLRSLGGIYNANPLTIIAARDERVDNEASIHGHQFLGGNSENLVKFDSDHCVPYELSRKPIMEYMVETLDLSQQ